MNDARNANYAALLLRVSLGAMFVAHALLKYFVFTLPGTAQFFAIHRPARRAGLRYVRRGAGRRYPAHRRRSHAPRLARAGAGPSRRHLGACGQRLALHFAQRRMGIPRVLDGRADRAGVPRRRRFAPAPLPTRHPATRLTLRTNERKHMKLYYSPPSARSPRTSRSSRAACPTAIAKVDLRKHTLEDGSDYYAINPKGYVPILELDDGTLLAEGVVILQYIADRCRARSRRRTARLERYRVMEWLDVRQQRGAQAVQPAVLPDDARRDEGAATREAREPLRVSVQGAGERSPTSRARRSRSPTRISSRSSTGRTASRSTFRRIPRSLRTRSAFARCRRCSAR